MKHTRDDSDVCNSLKSVKDFSTQIHYTAFLIIPYTSVSYTTFLATKVISFNNKTTVTEEKPIILGHFGHNEGLFRCIKLLGKSFFISLYMRFLQYNISNHMINVTA